MIQYKKADKRPDSNTVRPPEHERSEPKKDFFARALLFTIVGAHANLETPKKPAAPQKKCADMTDDELKDVIASAARVLGHEDAKRGSRQAKVLLVVAPTFFVALVSSIAAQLPGSVTAGLTILGALALFVPTWGIGSRFVDKRVPEVLKMIEPATDEHIRRNKLTERDGFAAPVVVDYEYDRVLKAPAIKFYKPADGRHEGFREEIDPFTFAREYYPAERFAVDAVYYKPARSK